MLKTITLIVGRKFCSLYFLYTYWMHFSVHPGKLRLIEGTKHRPFFKFLQWIFCLNFSKFQYLQFVNLNLLFFPYFSFLNSSCSNRSPPLSHFSLLLFSGFSPCYLHKSVKHRKCGTQISGSSKKCLRIVIVLLIR